MRYMALATVVTVAIVAAATTRIAHVVNRNEISRGVVLLKEGEYQRALEILRPRATQGDALSRTLVGRLYAFGLGVERDREVARAWLACGGNEHCRPGENEYFVSKDFEEGVGISPDQAEARFWLLASAEMGHARAIEDIQSSEDD